MPSLGECAGKAPELQQGGPGSGGAALGRSVARLLGEGRVKEQASPPLSLGARQSHLHITGVAPFVTGQL